MSTLPTVFFGVRCWTHRKDATGRGRANVEGTQKRRSRDVKGTLKKFLFFELNSLNLVSNPSSSVFNFFISFQMNSLNFVENVVG